MAAAAEADPLQRGALLSCLLDVGAADGARRLEALAAWPPDPRRDRWVVATMEALPYRTNSARRWWKPLLALAHQLRDPSLADRLAAWPPRGWAGVGATMAAWLVDRHDILVSALDLPTPAPLPPEAAAQLARLGAHRPPPPREGVLDDLLERVLAAPHDEAARLIYADALVEVGDPRGEFIHLQFKKLERGRTTADERRRERALLKQHRDAWLGPLAPVVQATGLRFTRGFLDRCRVRGDVEPVREHRLWRTVTHADAPGALLTSPAMAALTSAVARDDALPLLDGPDPRPLTTLIYEGPRIQPVEGARWGPAPAEVAAIQQLRGLPALRDLTLAMGHRPSHTSSTAYWLPLLDGPGIARLDRLVLGIDTDAALPLWLAAIAERQLAIPRIELATHARGGAWGDLRYLLELDEGKPTALTVRLPRKVDEEWQQHYEAQAAQALAGIDRRALSTLTIDARWTPGRPLRNAARRFRGARLTLP